MADDDGERKIRRRRRRKIRRGRGEREKRKRRKNEMATAKKTEKEHSGCHWGMRGRRETAEETRVETIKYKKRKEERKQGEEIHN